MVVLPVRLPAIDEASSQLEELVAEHARIALRGAPGSGRSTLLRALAARHAGDPEHPFILVAAPHGDDGAIVGLTQAAAQLDATGALSARMKDPDLRWARKLDEVVEALRRASGRTTLLLDQPLFQEPSPLQTIFRRRADELVSALLSVRDLRYILAPGAEAPAGAYEVLVRPQADVDALLDATAWGDLEDAARVLRPFHHALHGLSPLDIRLRVALVHAGDNPRQVAAFRAPPHVAVERWLSRLGPESRDVQALLGRLSVVRTAFDEALAERCGLAAVPSSARIVVRHALLFGAPDDLRLHETIAREAYARDWLGEQDRTGTHAIVAAWHQGRFESARAALRTDDAIRHELEEIHHLTEAGDAASLLGRSLWFVEQYDALGRSLSLRKRYDEAVQAYERALAHDPEDDYAHHYLAYNLDIQGREAGRVEASYREAIRLYPKHAWYESRWVSFLITRARMSEAHRAWEAALAELFASGPSDFPDIYRELHGEVARLLLHRGRLAFARDVLDDIPRWVRERAPWLDALCRLETLLAEAERDEVAFPPSIPLEERWQAPHLADPDELPRIRQWTPGRVAGVDEDEVHLRVALDATTFAWRDLPLDEYRALAGLRSWEIPAAGTYVEIHAFEDGRERLRSHRLTRFYDSALPKLWMSPDRYLRRAS